MLRYQIFFTTEAGLVLGVSELECPDDETAIAKASKMAVGERAELWWAHRRVAVLRRRCRAAQL